MLRKNNLQKIGLDNGRTTVSCQTDQFLQYLPLEQKLSDLLKRYKNIEMQLNEAKSKIQYLEFKNNYLQSSLCEMTYVFTNKQTEENLVHIRDIKQLCEEIKKQERSLTAIKENTSKNIETQISEILKNKNSKIQEKEYIDNSEHKNQIDREIKVDGIQPVLKQKKEINSCRIHSQFEKNKKNKSRQASTLTQRHLVVKSEIKHQIKNSNNRKNKGQTCVKKKNNNSMANDKQNYCQDDFAKKQAVLKYQQFMSNFKQSDKQKQKMANSTIKQNKFDERQLEQIFKSISPINSFKRLF